MIIFKGKTDRTISDLNIPAGFIVKTQEKAWMDDDVMKVWAEDIWIIFELNAKSLDSKMLF